jgi:hypothetical protein
MTPEQKIKHLILALAYEWSGETLPEITVDNIDALYEVTAENGGCDDAQNDVRPGEIETGLPCEYSRHYEVKAVAARALDGSWVGWTFWYGGGKHAEPEAIRWMDAAYDLTCTEEEKFVTVRTFAKVVV